MSKQSEEIVEHFGWVQMATQPKWNETLFHIGIFFVYSVFLINDSFAEWQLL